MTGYLFTAGLIRCAVLVRHISVPCLCWKLKTLLFHTVPALSWICATIHFNEMLNTKLPQPRFHLTIRRPQMCEQLREVRADASKWLLHMIETDPSVCWLSVLITWTKWIVTHEIEHRTQLCCQDSQPLLLRSHELTDACLRSSPSQRFGRITKIDFLVKGVCLGHRSPGSSSW